MRSLFLSVAFVATLTLVGSGGEIGFVEDFALAPDRKIPLQQLVPGTEDFYYYHALHALQIEQFDKVPPLVSAWVQRHGETPRVWQIRTRHALLTYDKDSGRSLDYLRQRLSLHFAHQRVIPGADPKLPVTLDGNEIGRDAFVNRANSITTDNLDLFEDSALDWLATYELGPNHRRSLLSRIQRPDYGLLVQKIVADLNHPNSGGFGSHPIHRQLTLAQLEALLKAKPELLTQQIFVVTYIIKLRPNPDVDWRTDQAELAAYLERLATFANRLVPSHNSLKAHVLFHQLLLDQRRGTPDKPRLMEYLKLPRSVGYASKRMLESDDLKRFPVNLNSNYDGATQLGPIGNDEPLIRALLVHFLRDARDTKEFEPYVNDVYLRHLFAEVKIVNGLGEREQWASLLSPEQFQQLKERVDLDFVPTNKTLFAPDEPVVLDVALKNTGTLIVKVFEINTQNYYRQQQREVNTDINLDGLVANIEQTYPAPESPFLRATRRFEFPKLTRPGVYVVDLIGNGRSSRALIRKGRLKHVQRITSAGHRLTILNDQNQEVKDARVWLSGHEYLPDADGSVTIPFTAAPGPHPIVITQGGLSSLDRLQHEGEAYALTAGIYVDRESLLKRTSASVVVRASLAISGVPVPLKLLEETQLTIVSTDQDGITSQQQVKDFTLFEDRETVHEFQVPARLSAIDFQLSAKVKQLSQGGQQLALGASQHFALNEIDKTDKIEQLLLVRTAAGYLLEVRGKSGEAKVARPVQLAIKHRDFKQPYHVTLQTDPAGRINLGALTDIAQVSATGPEGTTESWPMRHDSFTYPPSIHGREGEPLVVPYLPRDTDKALERSEVSLLEVRDDVFTQDRFEHLSVRSGLLVVDKLPRGDYDLLLKSSGARIKLRVTAGEPVGRFLVGSYRQLELTPLKPIQIASVGLEPVGPKGDGTRDAGNHLVIRLTNSTKFTRVHLFATRFVPEYDVYASLSRVRGGGLSTFQQRPAESVYLTGRSIGDEYQYIINRRYSQKFPGNTLERPSLLLNPWAVRTTETGEQVAVGGDDFGAVAAPPPADMSRELTSHTVAVAPTTNFPNLDFLAHGSAVLVNLVPDAKGVVEVDLTALGRNQQVHVVAVDPVNTTYRSVALPELKPLHLDLRLLTGLDSKLHFTQQKQISLLAEGATFELGDITTSKFEAYDSLARVYGLYAALSHDQTLAEFSFILNWPNLKPEEKRTLYSKYACHELSYFLFKKDPEFFKSVIAPYLANKKDQTFFDHYLLQADLAPYAQPWRYGQLNIAERALLGRRLAGEQARTSRHLSDLVAMVPPNVDNFIRLFDTAVQRSSLETDDVSGLTRARLELAAPAMMPAAGNAPGSGAGGMGGAGPEGAASAGMPAPADEPAEEARQLKAVEKKMGTAKDRAARRGDFAKKQSRSRDKNSNGVADAKELNGDVAATFFDEAEVEQLKRAEIRQLFRQLQKTQEWAENNYYHLTIDQQNADLVTISPFWRDYAAHDGKTPFVSKNLAEAARNFPEMLLALAVLDLPFESPKHETKFDGIKMTLKTGGPVVIYHEEIRPSDAPDGAAKVLVSQNFYRQGDRQRIEDGETVDNFVSEEFVVQTVYGCQVVITNPTSSRQKLNALIQIPQGAIPVLGSQATKTIHLTLEPYHTHTLDYHFYFPLAGKFAHFPVHVAKNDKLLTAAEGVILNVVETPTRLDTKSWEYVSQMGTDDEVLAFLQEQNVHAIDLDRIAWRMGEPKMFAAVLARLAERHAYSHTLWSYALKHNSVASAREFLQHADGIVGEIGGRIESTLVSIDPVIRRTYEHLEYKPLVNARAHALGKRRQIVNDRLYAQYHRTLEEMSLSPRLDDDDLLTATYYLLLQDRVADALATFARIQPANLTTRMQYDFCAAYLDFFSDAPQKARGIAMRYANHPVDRWRDTFGVIVAQLDEAEGKDARTVDPLDRNQQQTTLASTAPALDIAVEAKQIRIDYQNIDSARIHFYEMDVELLFSRNPFVQQFRGEFSSIRPNLTLDVPLPKDTKTQTLPLPEALLAKNVLVEVVAGGQTRTQPYYAHSLSVQTIENYGQVKVSHQESGKAVPKAYVKVYAQTGDGQVKFYKDGYTDIRGRFDYASLSTDDLGGASRFSILVLSEEFGAVVREAAPPRQ